MGDYTRLTESMRICLNVDRDSNCLSECFGCNYISHDDHIMDMVRDAADAIEELLEEKRLLESNNALQAQIIQHMKTIMKANGLSALPKGEKK